MSVFRAAPCSGRRSRPRPSPAIISMRTTHTLTTQLIGVAFARHLDALAVQLLEQPVGHLARERAGNAGAFHHRGIAGHVSHPRSLISSHLSGPLGPSRVTGMGAPSLDTSPSPCEKKQAGPILQLPGVWMCLKHTNDTSLGRRTRPLAELPRGLDEPAAARLGLVQLRLRRAERGTSLQTWTPSLFKTSATH